jgi:FKBP-type peptidyl-prolyl cis-trans isomerase FkpA
MKKALHRIVSSMLILGIAAGIAACGGGSASSSAADTSGSSAIVALKVTDTAVGTGATAAKNNKVTVHYTGWLYDVKASDLHGSKFDSSVDRGTPFAFTLGIGEVIKGWDQGVEGMKVGGKRTLVIPSSLAYGASGRGSIPGNAALVFDVELISVQ